MKQKALTIRLSENLLNDFDRVIEENSVNKSALIRSWIKDYVKKNKKEMDGMEKALKVIDEVENGERNLDLDWEPSFHEQPFTGGADEIFVGHFVEGLDGDDFVMVYYPEKKHIIDARNKNWMGDLSDEELEELLEGINGLDDRFDYGKVVAYSDSSGLHWL